ncbi:MAG: acetate--CoA ligase family protein [Candidatus Dormibacteraeota bacterium]|nr:acetate--CoA ligase family protein [Candidatus Dormibacteraeota bacterium]
MTSAQARPDKREPGGRERVRRILDADSLALVGATENSAWSLSLVTNLRTLGYGGRLHFVNPRYRSVFGSQCHPTIAAIPERVDCAYVMTGTDSVPAVVDDMAAAGVRQAVLLTAGYRETGPEGARREAELVARCRSHGITIQGPNCLGFINYRRQTAAYALPIQPPLLSGSIGLLSHSGAMLLHLHRLAHSRGIGLSYLVSSGNEAMLDANDFLEHLIEDDDTIVVGAHLEGIADAGRFLQLADRALAAGKPLVVLKAGTSPAGQRSAAAHTGALAVEDRVVDAAFRQSGVIRVASLEELVETAALLGLPRRPQGRRLAMLTASGGASSILADLAQHTRLSVPDLSPATRAELTEILPPFATPQNPLDTTGLVMQDMTLLPRSLAAIARDPTFDIALVVWDAPRDAGIDEARTESRLAAVAQAVRDAPIPTFVTSYVAGELTAFGVAAVRRNQIHFANGMPLAMRALDAAVAYTEAVSRRKAKGAYRWPRSGVPAPPTTGALSEVASLRLLARFGISVPVERVAHSALEAARLAREGGFPAVVKVISPDIPHKTEAGAVRLHLLTADEVATAYREVLLSARAFAPDARVEGVLVARQVFPVAELVAGIVRDPQFGPMILVGLGGVLVEVFGDVALRRAPIDFDEAVAMLGELRGRAVLEGVRGTQRGDLHAAASCLVRLGQMAAELDTLQVVDVNPLFVLPDGEGVIAGDALVVFGSAGGDNSDLRRIDEGKPEGGRL